MFLKDFVAKMIGTSIGAKKAVAEDEEPWYDSTIVFTINGVRMCPHVIKGDYALGLSISLVPSDISQAKYVSKKGVYCPRCRSNYVGMKPGSLEIEEEGSATLSCYCADCGSEWDDVFVLVGYRMQGDEPDEEEEIDDEEE